MNFYYRQNLLVPYSENTRRFFASWQNGIRTVCISGGRGKGKTIDVCLYLLKHTNLTPGMQVVVARSEYATIAGSIIKTLQERVFKYPLGDSRNRHPKNPFTLVGGVDRPSVLRFDNGSEWRFIGLDDKTKRSGTECDIFWLNEGQREETSEVWGHMGGTLAGGRGGNWNVRGTRFSQMIADANPDSKFHWLYKAFHDDEDNPLIDTELWLEFTHHDNPALTEKPGSTLNADGEQTVKDLLNFYPPGFERQRMVWGEWCAAEGIVYSMYDPKSHEIAMQRRDFGADTKWQAAIDHGGTSPFAFMLTGQNENTFRTFKEIAMSRCTIEEVIARTDALLERYSVPKENLENLFADTNVPGFNKALREAGYPVVEADKDILAGVSTVKHVIGDNRYFINKNSLDDRDPNYDGPQGFKEEVLGYAYLPKDKQETSAKPNHPVGKRNHWCDALRYKLYGLRASIIVFPAIMAPVANIDRSGRVFEV